MTRTRSLVVFALVLAITAAAIAGPLPWTAHAQGDGTLPYNEPVIAGLTPGQAATLTFTAFAGDSFALTLSRLSDFSFSAVLIDPGQNASLLAPGPDGNIAATFDAVAQGGAYQVVMQSEGTGDVLILLTGTPVEPVDLALGETVVDLGTEPLRFSLTPPDGVPETYLSIAILSEDPAVRISLPGLSLVDPARGATVLLLQPGALTQLAMVLPAPTVFYLSLDPGETPLQLVITWDVTVGTVPPGGALTPAAPGSASGACQVTFAGGVNVRSGPGVAYPILGTAAIGSTLPVMGRTTDSSWWQIGFNGMTGWVYAGLATVQSSGDCAAVPVAFAPPPPPTAMLSATVEVTVTPTTDTTTTATVTPTTDTSATATWTPTITPSWSPTWTWTPTATVTPTWTWTPTATWTPTP